MSEILVDKGPVMRSFDVFFAVNPNKHLIKKSSCRLSETPRRSCNVTVIRQQPMFPHTYSDRMYALNFRFYTQGM